MTLLDSTLGAAFLGCIAAAIFYGVTSVQAFIYFQNQRDGKLFQLLIFSLWVCDSLHLAVTIHGMYWYLVTNFGKLGSIAYPVWSLVAGVYFTNLSDIAVRGVYSHRLFVLCGRGRRVLRILLPAIVTTLAVVVFVCGVAFGSFAFELKTFDRLNHVSILLYLSFAAAVIADLTVAISLCILFFRSRTGIKRTDSILSLLMAFSINTGLLTSLFAIACFVTYALWPSRFVFLGLYFPLSKLYVNSLFASLNARQSLRFTKERLSTEPTANHHDGVSTQIVFPMHSRSSGTAPSGSKTVEGEDQDAS
ncbi:hypothetical protein CPB83DRAFT_819631 [Crepidotus variabilis]|uniref:DUF6534 domain-containing protein n=1 Tax=Crepidotus variabilis TaxID=179855 RepID=A0A9P6E8Q4_9AGAR|nr:hypothetical protein CPB83DRAFT_819631 [Crepidotus variabilis]